MCRVRQLLQARQASVLPGRAPPHLLWKSLDYLSYLVSGSRFIRAGYPPAVTLTFVRDGATDRDWESFASQEPYWSVLSADEFRSENLTPERLACFFNSGKKHVESVVNILANRFSAPRVFNLTLDFGCGVGRLLLPLAEVSGKSIGVDVSPTMLRLCRQHLREREVENVELYQSDDKLEAVEQYAGSIDLITSYIVFQHITPRRGCQIFDQLLRLLRPGGAAFLHFTFAAEIQSLQYEACNVTGSLYGFYQRTSEGLTKLGEYPAGDVQIQMNHYNVNDLLCRLHRHGIPDAYVSFTNHSGTLGIELYFRKPI